MAEISNDAADQLRQAILQQSVWSEMAAGHFEECETLGLAGHPDTYVSVDGGTIPADTLSPETQERLGLDAEALATSGVNIALGKKLAGNGERTWLEDIGENSLAVRLSTTGNPLDGSGKWLHLDYLLSAVTVSERPDVPPLTYIRTKVMDETAFMKAIYVGNQNDSSIFTKAYTKAPVDPETDEPDPELLIRGMKGDELMDLATDTPEAAEAAKSEQTVNQGMAEFALSLPLSDSEIITLAGLIRRIEAERNL